MQIVFYFPAPICLALLLQRIITFQRARRIIQSVVYLPHFISWVIVVSLWQQVLGGSGIFVHTLRDLGLPVSQRHETEPGFFKPLVTLQLMWKETGYATIIFLAALLNIDSSLYEAALVDGAGRWQRLWNVTLPGIMGVVILLLILRLGLILSVGFEQILLQRNAVGPAAGEVLDTYVYFKGIVGGQWGVTAAAGLIKGIIGTALVIAANKFAHRMKASIRKGSTTDAIELRFAPSGRRPRRRVQLMAAHDLIPSAHEGAPGPGSKRKLLLRAGRQDRCVFTFIMHRGHPVPVSERAGHQPGQRG